MDLVEGLHRIAGQGRVLTDDQAREGYRSDTSCLEGVTPACVVRPQDTSQVQQIVRLANREGFHLVPVSSRGPHTRGDTVPLAEHTVVLDLCDMDAIRRIDRRNKVAMVEPGVTFAALEQAAAAVGLRPAMPLAPRATKSVVGSILEREPTLLPKYHWDMSDPLCCLEVVFGEGSLFRTGSAAGPGTLEEQWAAGQAQKSPMGPSQTDWAKLIQGAQGSMGIVTWASVKLELLPTRQQAFVLPCADPADFIAFTYTLLQRRLPDVCLMLNRSSLAALLDDQAAASLPEWALIYSLSGHEHLPAERLRYLQADIAEIAAAHKVRPVQDLGGLAAADLLAALTSPGSGWKLRPQGGHQDIFFLTTLGRAPEFARAMQATAAAHGLAPQQLGAYLQPVQQGRACHVEFSLFYDPADAAATQAMWALFHDASRTLMDMGGFFSRPYGSWAAPAYAKSPQAARALQKVKAVLDPAGVLNPGRLCFTLPPNATPTCQ